jgi:hypothetical protein
MNERNEENEKNKRKTGGFQIGITPNEAKRLGVSERPARLSTPKRVELPN